MREQAAADAVGVVVAAAAAGWNGMEWNICSEEVEAWYCNASPLVSEVH